MSSDKNSFICKEHDREYEGLCKTCNEVICASCVMFGNHKKHDIVSLKEGSMFLRKEIDKYIFKGLLKKEHIESRLLEIKEKDLLIEKNNAETIKKIEDIFKGLTSILKQRKNELINEIIDRFNVEKEKVDAAEADWMYKQEISEQLTIFDKEKNNENLLLYSKYILDGIRRLSEPSQFTELLVYNDLNTDLSVDLLDQNGDIKETIEISLEELNRAFQSYVTLKEPESLVYKA